MPRNNQTSRLRLGFRFIGVDVKTEIAEALRIVADSRELTASDIVREVLREWMGQQTATVIAQAKKKAAGISATQQALRDKEATRLEADRERKKKERAKAAAEQPSE